MPQDVQIRYRSVLEYETSQISSNAKPGNTEHFQNSKTYSGEITKHSRRRMERACELFLQSTQYKYVYNKYRNCRHKHHMSFITLTMQVQEYKISDIKKNCLQPFLEKLHRLHGLNKYIWKIELTKQGMPHFHIITDSWIDYKIIRNTWNTVLAKHGYLNKYFSQHTHYNANSTDVRSSKNQKASVGYMVKYVCKNVESVKDKFTFEDYLGTDKIGKVWDCSFNLKKYKYYSTIATWYHTDILNKLVQAKKVIAKQFDNFNLYIFTKANPIEILTTFEQHEYNQLINQINTT